MTEFVASVKLTADGKQLVGEVRVAADEVDKLTGAAKRNKSEAEQLRDTYQRTGAQMNSTTAAIKTAAEATASFIASLERQKALYGKSATDALRYDAAMLGMSKSQRAYTEELLATADANEKASLGSKKLAGSLGNLSNLAQQAAAAFGLWKAAQYMKDAALLNARYETLGISMEVVGRNSGYTAQQMGAAAQGMQSMGISMVESRQQAMRLVQAHIELADSQKLARIAQDAAVIGNMNSSEAFATMIHGIQSGQTDVLRNIGLNISMEQSYRTMAAALHKNADELTQNEKTQAVLNAVIEKGRDIAGTYAAAMGTAGKQMNSMVRYTEDLKVKQGEVFNEVLTVGVMAFTEHLKDANNEVSELARNGELMAWGTALKNIFVEIVNAIDNAMTGIKMLAQWAAHRGNLSAINDQYDRRADSVVSRPGANLGSDRAELVKIQVEREAAIAAENKFYDSAQLAMAGFSDRLLRADEERTQALAEKAAKAHADALARDKTYYEASVSIAQQYGQDTAMWRKQQQALYESFNGKETGHYTDNTAISKSVSEYGALIKKLEDLGKADQKEADVFGQSASYKLRYTASLEAAEAWSASNHSARAAQEISDRLAVIVASADQLAAEEAEAEASKNSAELAKEMNKIWQDQIDTIQKSTAGVVEDTARLKDQAYELRYGKEALEALNSARRAETVATLQATLASIDETAQCSLEAEAIRLKIKALEDYQAAASDNTAAQQQHDASIKAVQDQAGMWMHLDRTAHDTFVSVANGNKDFWSRLKESAKNIFFDWLYQMTAHKWLVNVATAVGSSAMADAAFGADGGMPETDFLQAGQTIWNGFSGSMATGLGNLAISAGSMFGSSALGSFGAGMASPTLGAAGGLGVAGSMGSAFATAMPYIAAAVVAAGVFGIGQHGAPAVSTASGGRTFDAAGNVISTIGENQSQSAMDMFDRLGGLLAGWQSALGISGKGGYFGFASDTGRGGQNPNFGLTYGTSAQDIAYQQHGVPLDQANLTLVASRAIFTALQGADIPQYLSGVFGGKDAMGMSQADIDSALQFAGALKKIHDGFEQARDPVNFFGDQIDALDNALGVGVHTAASFKAAFQSALESGTMTPAQLAQWQALGAAIDNSAQAVAGLQQQLAALQSISDYANFDPVTAGLTAAKTAGQTLWETWNSQGFVLANLTATYDGSIAATQALASATKDRYATEMQMVRDIAGIMQGVSEHARSSIFNYQYGLQDNQGKYSMLDARETAAEAMMRNSAQDIYARGQAAIDAQNLLDQAWSLLDATQQQAHLQEFIAKQSGIDNYINDPSSGIGPATLQAIKNGSAGLKEDIATAIKDALNDVASQLADAAIKQASAADRQIVAAGIPVQVQVSSTVVIQNDSAQQAVVL